MAHITGFAGVILWTEHLDPMLAFYRDTLGLSPRHVKPGFANFDWNGIRLSISEHSGIHGQSADPLRVMVNLAVEDIHALCEQLATAGVRFTRMPGREDFGWVATLHDPDGNTIQLFEFDR